MLQRTFFNVNLPMKLRKQIDKLPKEGGSSSMQICDEINAIQLDL